VTLPNLLVIGAMKCGTTSLHHYLGLHPEIFMSRRKELDFFIEDLNWKKGIAWYAAQFPEPAAIRGEASPRYSLHPVYRGVPQRIHQVLPDVKLVYVVRDPVQRVISHYMHDVIERSEQRTLEAILEQDERNHYVHCSRYWMQLEQYRCVFPTRQVLVIRQEDLLEQRAGILRSVFRFLEVDESFASWRTAARRHQTTRKRQLSHSGRVLRESILGRLLDRMRPELRGYLEWLLFYPFSRAVERFRPPVPLVDRLEELFREDTRRLEDGWEIAQPLDESRSPTS
jgi:hypothetical protein